MATKKRLKAAAQKWIAQSQDDVASAIRQIGEVSRDVARLTADMNDEIAVITQKYQALITPKQERLFAMQTGVQGWCEANRAKLTNDGKVKTANLITGNVLWRKRPASIAIRGVDSVIETLKKHGLNRFVRTKEEINKEAMLNEPDAVRGIAGITVVKDVEDFVIEPFEQETTA